MKKRVKRTKTIKVIKQSIICLFLLLTLIGFNIYIFKNNLITPRLDELTTSYVSFYNQYSTDILKITNLEKMNDSKGKKLKRNLEFTISGDKKISYNVLLYPIQNNIPDKYVKISIQSNNKEIVKTIDSFKKNENGGYIIYSSNKPKEKIKVKMWVSEEYKEQTNNTSFEIRIKQR